MKSLLISAIALMSFGAFAKDIALSVNYNRHLNHIDSAKLSLTYESQSTAVGCQTYSGDIMSPLRPVYIEKKISVNNGVASEIIQTELERCNAVLKSVNLNIRMNRKAVARTFQVAKSDVDKNRIDFDFNVFEARPGVDIHPNELRVLKLYVAGQEERKLTFSSSFEAAVIIDDAITLNL